MALTLHDLLDQSGYYDVFGDVVPITGDHSGDAEAAIAYAKSVYIGVGFDDNQRAKVIGTSRIGDHITIDITTPCRWAFSGCYS